MKKHCLVLLLLSIIFSNFCIAQQHCTIKVDGMLREYYLYVPHNIELNAPLVFVYHGYTGNAKGTMEEFGMNAVAESNKFVVCYPQGSKDVRGDTFWQVGYSFHKNQKVNDVKFITTLASVLQKKYHLSKENTFMTGFSNGGDLCNYLACKTSGVFKAMAPIISCIMKDTYDLSQSMKPIPVFMLNGTKDRTTYWEGDMNDTEGFGPYFSTPAMLELRLSQNKCSFASSDTLRPTEVKDSTYVVMDKYINKSTKAQVWMYNVINGDHGYPEYLKLQEEVWKFFSMYLKK